MTSQPGKQTIAIHILAIISRSKGSQTMKFGQLIEYKRGKCFQKSRTQNEGEETIPRSFFKKSKLSISLDQFFKSFIQFVFIVCQVGGYL